MILQELRNTVQSRLVKHAGEVEGNVSDVTYQLNKLETPFVDKHLILRHFINLTLVT